MKLYYVYAVSDISKNFITAYENKEEAIEFALLGNKNDRKNAPVKFKVETVII